MHGPGDTEVPAGLCGLAPGWEGCAMPKDNTPAPFPLCPSRRAGEIPAWPLGQGDQIASEIACSLSSAGIAAAPGLCRTPQSLFQPRGTFPL